MILKSIAILILQAVAADLRSDQMAFVEFAARYGRSYASKEVHEDRFITF